MRFWERRSCYPLASKKSFVYFCIVFRASLLFVYDVFHHVLVSLHRKTVMPPIEERAASDG